MNDAVINKVQSIQRCVQRAREEYQAAGEGFLSDYTRQDAAVLNITRACEQAIDLADHTAEVWTVNLCGNTGAACSLVLGRGVFPARVVVHGQADYPPYSFFDDRPRHRFRRPMLPWRYRLKRRIRS